MVTRYKTLTLLLSLFLLSALTSHALALQKHALLIGINDYQNIPSLKKAVGDAKAMAQTMQKLGFKVTLVLNPTRRNLNQAITKFRAAIEPGDTALVHYSGHGIEINGRNFLLPADIPKPNAGEQDLIESESLSLNATIDRVASSGAAVRIFIIDACRDNPFAKEGTRSLGGTRGLAEVTTTAGTFIFYSAGFGQTALDALGPNDTVTTSVYTRTLIKTIQKPFSHIGSIARKVRQEVEKLAKSVGHTQFPAYYDELSGDYCIVCGNASAQIANNSNNPNAGHGIPSTGAANNNQASLNSGGNLSQPQNLSDLIVTHISLQPTGQCKAGRPVMNSNIILKNIGQNTAGTVLDPVFVAIKNTKDVLKGWGNGTAVGIIAPGQETTAYFPVFFPEGKGKLINGLQEFKVTIDPKHKLTETNKQNNIGYKEIAFSCPKITPAYTPPPTANNRYDNDRYNDNSQSTSYRPAPLQPARNLPRGGPKSFWNHSGSLMFLKSDGNKRAFFYKNPRRILKASGVRDGSLLFHGKIAGGNYIGKMRKFSRRCGTIEFNVRGLVHKDRDAIRVIFKASVPTRNIRTCRITGSKRQTLVFKFLYSAKNKTNANQIRPLDPRIKPPFIVNRPFLKKQTFQDNNRYNNRRFNKTRRPNNNRRPIRFRRKDN